MLLLLLLFGGIRLLLLLLLPLQLLLPPPLVQPALRHDHAADAELRRRAAAGSCGRRCRPGVLQPLHRGPVMADDDD